MLLPAIAIGLWATYALLILRYHVAWRKTVPFTIPEGHVPQTHVSVIIAARNEADRIGACLSDLLVQDHPRGLYEIIVADDHSTDGTAAVVEGFSVQGVRLIRMASEGQGRTGKKAALDAAVRAARGTLILATDADCRIGPSWLRTMAACHETGNLDFIAAPVRFLEGGGALGTFQRLDFLSLQGITAAAVGAGYHGMCNGANLAYRKSVFEAVGGFDGIDGIASGDDMLLLQKVARHPGTRIGYCLSQEAIVDTPTAPDLTAFLRQRIRWASKARFYEERRIFFVLLLVWLANLSLPLLALAGLIHDPLLLRTAGCLLLGKTTVELAFLWPVAGFFGMRRSLAWFPAAQPFHVLYTVMAGLLGQMGPYEWKGRRVR